MPPSTRLFLLASAFGPSITTAVWLRMQVGGREPYWPTKGGDFNHSGFSRFTGPFDLSKPAWTFEEPRRKEKGVRNQIMKVFHGSPMIDGEYNVYIQSTTGWVYSLDRQGRLRWEFETSSGNPSNVALDNVTVYTIADDGMAFAIDAATGRERWRSKVARHAPDDTHSLTVVGDTLLTACSSRDTTQMNEAVCALSTHDGRVKWTYSMQAATGRQDATAANQMQAAVQGNVIFADDFGSVYCVSLASGRELWRTQNITSAGRIVASHGMAPYGTTATGIVGGQGLVFHPFNAAGGQGIVTARSLDTGRLVWQRPLDLESNAAPATGVLQPGGRSVLVVPVGSNPGMVAMSPLEQALYQAGVIKPLVTKVLALDASTGETVWTFTPPRWDGRVAGSFVSTEGSGDLCAPDNYGMPTVGADGTVYVNWSGGYAFALRDANGDGTVDGSDPREVSSYQHGFGSNGATALAPGFAVAPSCRQLVAWAA